MTDKLALESVRKLNMFPAKGGVSPYFSPEVILHNTVIDYKKHCAIPFGSYVQAINDDRKTKNRNHARTIDAIYLRPMYNQQGGHEIMNLTTGKVITRQH